MHGTGGRGDVVAAAQGFLKAPLSADGGVGPLSIGIILDREWEL